MSWRNSFIVHAAASGDVWVNATLNLVCWYDTSLSKRLMREPIYGVGRRLLVDTYYLMPCCEFINYRLIYLVDSYTYSTSWCVWYDGTQYVLTSSYMGSTIEFSAVEGGVTVWKGTTWYSSPTVNGTYTGRGLAHGTTKVVAWETFNGWQLEVWGPEGEYQPQGTKTGTVRFGWRILLISSSSALLLESPTRSHSRAVYEHNSSTKTDASILKQLWWNGVNWILSVAVDSLAYPYWQGPATLSPAGAYAVVVAPATEYEGTIVPASLTLTVTTSAYKEYTAQIDDTQNYYQGNVGLCL